MVGISRDVDRAASFQHLEHNPPRVPGNVVVYEACLVGGVPSVRHAACPVAMYLERAAVEVYRGVVRALVVDKARGLEHAAVKIHPHVGAHDAVIAELGDVARLDLAAVQVYLAELRRAAARLEHSRDADLPAVHRYVGGADVSFAGGDLTRRDCALLHDDNGIAVVPYAEIAHVQRAAVYDGSVGALHSVSHVEVLRDVQFSSIPQLKPALHLLGRAVVIRGQPHPPGREAAVVRHKQSCIRRRFVSAIHIVGGRELCAVRNCHYTFRVFALGEKSLRIVAAVVDRERAAADHDFVVRPCTAPEAAPVVHLHIAGGPLKIAPYAVCGFAEKQSAVESGGAAVYLKHSFGVGQSRVVPSADVVGRSAAGEMPRFVNEHALRASCLAQIDVDERHVAALVREYSRGVGGQADLDCRAHRPVAALLDDDGIVCRVDGYAARNVQRSCEEEMPCAECCGAIGKGCVVLD